MKGPDLREKRSNSFCGQADLHTHRCIAYTLTAAFSHLPKHIIIPPPCMQTHSQTYTHTLYLPHSQTHLSPTSCFDPHGDVTPPTGGANSRMIRFYPTWDFKQHPISSEIECFLLWVLNATVICCFFFHAAAAAVVFSGGFSDVMCDRDNTESEVCDVAFFIFICKWFHQEPLETHVDVYPQKERRFLFFLSHTQKEIVSLY